jgi:uncharacterized protein YdcH (DUF465 family)
MAPPWGRGWLGRNDDGSRHRCPEKLMEKRDEELIQSLIDQDPELRKHYLEHVDFERRIEAFNEKTFLSADEELERKKLQKLKLAGKDRIMEILGRHRGNQAASHH